MQRIFDIIFSFLALLVLAPFLLPVMVILRLTGEGEVFYIQQRAGFKGNEFGLLKFATMLKDSPRIGTGEITVKGDPRVLPFGKLLRKTKLNELPQLWNIFIGDMSVVGPRPMVPNTYSHYPSGARKKLNTIRPGLTGIGSIVFRDEERYLAGRNQPMEFYRGHIIPYKSDLEVWFVDNNSIWLYFKVILVTAWVVLFPASTIVEKIFKGIPQLPDGLKS
ncbi:sugar transferase [Akkermansiaceae bacterium]|nr:sugar transferase [Akkermansiaceae bacterium]